MQAHHMPCSSAILKKIEPLEWCFVEINCTLDKVYCCYKNNPSRFHWIQTLKWTKLIKQDTFRYLMSIAKTLNTSKIRVYFARQGKMSHLQ